MSGLDRNWWLIAMAIACTLAAGCGRPKERDAASPDAGAGDPARAAKGERGGEVAGVPIYPGARYMEDLSRERSRLGTSEGRLTGMETRVWIYYSEDAAEKVIRWYADKLGGRPVVTGFDLGRIDKLRLGERGTEAQFTLAPLAKGREGSRSLAVIDHDIRLPPGGVKPGERVRVRIVDTTTIRIAETLLTPGRRAPGEEPPS